MTASTPLRPFFPIANIIDGDPKTAWATIFTLFHRDASIVLDLGGEKSITALSLYASRLFGIDFLPATLELQISNDNATWRTITASEQQSVDGEAALTDNLQLRGAAGRYIKLCVGGRTSWFLLQVAQIAELEIYGCDADDHLPFSLPGGGSPPTDGAAAGASVPAHTAKNPGNPPSPSVPGKPLVSFH